MNSQKQSYYQHKRSEMIPFMPSEYSRVLEIGCGEGGFRSNFIDKEHEYWGVEMQTNMPARERLDKVLVGTYDEVSNNLPDHYFDLIVCNDVVEHMENHIAFLNNIKSKLSASGRLVLSIPNVRYIANLAELLFQKDWRYRDSGILDRTHLRFFTKKSLIQVLAQTGWTINKIEGINRYGHHRIGHKLLLSYIGQFIFGAYTAYLQYAVNLSIKNDVSINE